MRTKYRLKFSFITLFGAAALAGIVTLGAPAEARAQACCAATGAGEFSVVGRCQSAVLAAQLSVERAHGTYTDEGVYRGLKESEVDDMILSIGGGFRPFHPMWQVYGSVPMRLQYRSFGGADGELSPGLGDMSAGLRWTALEDMMQGLSTDDWSSFIPFVDLYLTVKAPTGRAPEQSKTQLGADITGDGFWQAAAGMKVSKFLTAKHVLSANAGYAYALSRQIDYARGTRVDFAPGDSLDLGLSYLYMHNIFWSWGLTSSLKMEGQAKADGRAIADSETRRLRFGAHVTHGFSFPFWEATLSVMVDSWWDGASSNVPFVGPAATFGVRRHFL